MIAAGADMHADLAAFARSEARQDLVVQFDEAAQEIPGGIELEGETAFGEVDLDVGCARSERPADVRFGFGPAVLERNRDEPVFAGAAAATGGAGAAGAGAASAAFGCAGVAATGIAGAGFTGAGSSATSSMASARR